MITKNESGKYIYNGEEFDKLFDAVETRRNYEQPEALVAFFRADGTFATNA